jgi:hypothetical protein
MPLPPKHHTRLVNDVPLTHVAILRYNVSQPISQNAASGHISQERHRANDPIRD